MKNKSIIFIAFLNIFFIIFMNSSTYMGLNNVEKTEPDSLKIENIDFKKIRNGEFIGEYNININSARVIVFVKDGVVTKINIHKHHHGPGHGAEKIIEEIIKKQSIDVDAVSGATKSSNVLKKAVENALMKGI
jgi:uncharacterized protein with FMN-binding domain